ncbi:MAG: hypothetical protein SF029_25010 [bacterium]|nr:hypothetical protein [bacterium]
MQTQSRHALRYVLNGKPISFLHIPEPLGSVRLYDDSPESSSLSFYTVLLFKPDEFTTESAVRDVVDDVSVGLLSVIVVVGLKYVQIRIGAVASSQNDLLRYSMAVHEAMTDILARAQGIAGLIDVESYDLLLLTNPSRIIRIDFDEEERFKDGRAIDEITEEIIRQLNVAQ